MSLTYGYDLKDNDDIITAPVQAVEAVSRFALPGAAMVNHLPFCMLPGQYMLWCAHRSLQCGTSLHGSHGSAMNHWHS